MIPLPTEFEPLDEALVESMAFSKFGLYFRSLLMKKKNTVVPQHVHDLGHATIVGAGRARGWANGEWIGDKGPGEIFDIDPYIEHVFQALEENTFMSCVHDEKSAESVKAKGL